MSLIQMYKSVLHSASVFHCDGFTTYWLSIRTKLVTFIEIALHWQLFSLKMTIFSNLTKLIEKG